MTMSAGVLENDNTSSVINVTSEKEVYTLVRPRKPIQKSTTVDDDEPLIDTTEAIPLKSKRTDRKAKKLEKRLKRTTVKSDTKSFLELPSELLHEILTYLRPSEIIRLQRLSKATKQYVHDNEDSIARDIIRRRYWILYRSFPIPVPLEKVDDTAKLALSKGIFFGESWQTRQRRLHTRPYQQHVRPVNPKETCTCFTCLMAWNNLCVLLDLAHFQDNFDHREPLPTIPRGTYPEWNRTLVDANAAVVERAMARPLYHALILQVHLSTITRTLTRTARIGKKTSQSTRLYHISVSDVAAETDDFLERSGPPSLQFPFNRDQYHYIEAYVPNRRWNKEMQTWIYYVNTGTGQSHENDLVWTVARYQPEVELA